MKPELAPLLKGTIALACKSCWYTCYRTSDLQYIYIYIYIVTPAISVTTITVASYITL